MANSPTKRPVPSVPSHVPDPVQIPTPVRDLGDPAQRFELKGIARLNHVPLATILDHKTGKRHQLKEGSKLLEYQLTAIDLGNQSVTLHGPDKIELQLKRQH